MDAGMSLWLVAGSTAIAVYRTKEKADAEAARLEADYQRTSPSYEEWHEKRRVVWDQWRAATGEKLECPDGQYVVDRIGPMPQLLGHRTCYSVEVEDRLDA